MKTHEAIAKAAQIGNDSWQLQAFAALPPDATADEQIAAIRNDKRWQWRHWSAIETEMDNLIHDIELGSQANDAD